MKVNRILCFCGTFKLQPWFNYEKLILLTISSLATSYSTDVNCKNYHPRLVTVELNVFHLILIIVGVIPIILMLSMVDIYVIFLFSVFFLINIFSLMFLSVCVICWPSSKAWWMWDLKIIHSFLVEIIWYMREYSFTWCWSILLIFNPKLKV